MTTLDKLFLYEARSCLLGCDVVMMMMRLLEQPPLAPTCFGVVESWRESEISGFLTVAQSANQFNQSIEIALLGMGRGTRCRHLAS